MKLLKIFLYFIILPAANLIGMEENNFHRTSILLQNPLPYEIFTAYTRQNNITLVKVLLPECYKPSVVTFKTNKKNVLLNITAPPHNPQYGKIIISTDTEKIATAIATTDPVAFHAQEKNNS